MISGAIIILAAILHVSPAVPFRAIDRTCLAVTAYTESRGEGAAGMAAVMDVVINRSTDAKHRWPRTLCGVATQRDQFAGLNYWTGHVEPQSWHSAVALADIALTGAPLVPDECRGSVFFSAQPRTKNITCRIGKHTFSK